MVMVVGLLVIVLMMGILVLLFLWRVGFSGMEVSRGIGVFGFERVLVIVVFFFVLNRFIMVLLGSVYVVMFLMMLIMCCFVWCVISLLWIVMLEVVVCGVVMIRILVCGRSCLIEIVMFLVFGGMLMRSMLRLLKNIFVRNWEIVWCSIGLCYVMMDLLLWRNMLIEIVFILWVIGGSMRLLICVGWVLDGMLSRLGIEKLCMFVLMRLIDSF